MVAGKFGSPRVTLEVATPRRERAVAVYAAAHVQSGSPPRPDVKYQIDFSTDGGQTWRPVVKDWTVSRRGDEPKDFWSQSCCWGSAEVKDRDASSVRVRFHNSGGRAYARCEVHLVYRTAGADGTRVTFAWDDDRGSHRASHRFSAGGEKEPAAWQVPTGRNVQTRWVEFTPAP
jgi:hypothetical protein